MTITLNSLSAKLFIYISLRIFSHGIFILLFHLEHFPPFPRLFDSPRLLLYTGQGAGRGNSFSQI